MCFCTISDNQSALQHCTHSHARWKMSCKALTDPSGAIWGSVCCSRALQHNHRDCGEIELATLQLRGCLSNHRAMPPIMYIMNCISLRKNVRNLLFSVFKCHVLYGQHGGVVQPLSSSANQQEGPGSNTAWELSGWSLNVLPVSAPTSTPVFLLALS